MKENLIVTSKLKLGLWKFEGYWLFEEKGIVLYISNDRLDTLLT